MCIYNNVKIPMVSSEGEVFFALPELRRAIGYATHNSKNFPAAVRSLVQNLRFPDGKYRAAISLDGCKVYAACAGPTRSPGAFREAWDAFLVYIGKRFPAGQDLLPGEAEGVTMNGPGECSTPLPEEVKACLDAASEFIEKLNAMRATITQMVTQFGIQNMRWQEAEERLEYLKASLRGVLAQSVGMPRGSEQ